MEPGTAKKQFRSSQFVPAEFNISQVYQLIFDHTKFKYKHGTNTVPDLREKRTCHMYIHKQNLQSQCRN